MNDPERDPFKVFVLAVSAVVSPVMFVRFDQLAGPTLHTFPDPYGRVFLAWLFISAGTALYGVIRQRNVSGVLWERTGMYGVTFLFVTYGVWAAAVFGGPAFGFASLLISLGLAAIVRIRQINKRRRKVR